jgi:hypothetical protein
MVLFRKLFAVINLGNQGNKFLTRTYKNYEPNLKSKNNTYLSLFEKL